MFSMRRSARTAAVAILILVACAGPAFAEATLERVSLDYFFSPGCPECERFKRTVIPELESRFEGFYDLSPHDMNKAETIPLLLAYQRRCGNTRNGRISLIVDHTDFLSGYATISTGMCDRINEAFTRRQAEGWTPPAPPEVTKEETDAIARKGAEAVTLSVVAFGGLVDGVNPCAISTLIFFLSVLAVAKAARRTRLLVGISFIAASFLTYTALGLGILLIFRQAPSFNAVKRTVETVIGLGMIPLAALSFRDALRFRRSGRPEDVSLQIPKRIKSGIHAFMNARLGVGGPILGGLITGAGVTVLESVCTGQSYIPTLAYIIKSDGSDVHAWVLLLVYNLLFILPLAAVFICFHRGVQLQALIGWSKRNLVGAKILLGLFFAAMAVLLLWPK
jgi:cytochrome c biogenesis protein CcdA